MTINYKLKNQNFFFDSLDITAHCRGSLQTAHIEDREKGIAQSRFKHRRVESDRSRIRGRESIGETAAIDTTGIEITNEEGQRSTWQG